MDKIDNAVTYQYRVLRYRHDIFTGEFVNVGLVYFDPATHFLKAAMLLKYKRISQFFGEVSGVSIQRTLRQLKVLFDETARKVAAEPEFFLNKSVADITSSVLPTDDNAFIFSETFRGWHFDHEVSFSELYHRIVEQYIEPSTKRHDDAYAWKHVYKAFFDKYHLTEKLESHTVKTAADAFDFDKTYQNGALHCFQSLSFELKNDIDIKNKIYLWGARIDELKTAEQKVKLYLLSVYPKRKEHLDLLKIKLDIHAENVEVVLVQEKDAEQEVQKVKAELEAAH